MVSVPNHKLCFWNCRESVIFLCSVMANNYMETWKATCYSDFQEHGSILGNIIQQAPCKCKVSWERLNSFNKQLDVWLEQTKSIFYEYWSSKKYLQSVSVKIFTPYCSCLISLGVNAQIELQFLSIGGMELETTRIDIVFPCAEQFPYRFLSFSSARLSNQTHQRQAAETIMKNWTLYHGRLETEVVKIVA